MENKLQQEPFKEGEYVFAHYNNPYNELDMYFGKIIKLGEYYSTVVLFIGEELRPKSIYGTYSDVCTADIGKVDPKFCEGKTLELILENRKKLGFNPPTQ